MCCRWEKSVEQKEIATTRRELYLWYFYDFANSPFASAGIPAFIPLLLNDYAIINSDVNCKVPFLGMNLAPSSFSSTVISLSVIVQVIMFISIGALGDYMHLKKYLLLFWTIIGGLACCSFFLMTDPSMYGLCAILLIVSNVSYGLGIIYYNSLLPLISKNMPKFLNNPERATEAKVDKMINEISGNGGIIGFVGAIIYLGITVPLVIFSESGPGTNYTVECADYAETFNESDSTGTYRIVLFILGIWWIFFGILAVVPIRSRKGKTLPEGRSYLTISFVTVWETLKKIRKLPNLGLFFLAYFIASDTYGTIISITVIFANDELNISTLTITIVLLLIPIVGIFGVWFFERVKICLKIPTNKMLCFHLLSFCILSLYCFIGIFPDIPFGLKRGNDWEIIVGGIWFALHVGPTYTYLRSYYGQLLPRGFESEFYSFFEISDKGSSWIGPLLAALIRELTGTLRWTYILLAFLCLVPVPMFLKVSVEKSKSQNKQFLNSINIKNLSHCQFR